VGDDISSDAIICAAPDAAGPTHERDPAPAREEESGGAESAVASFVAADSSRATARSRVSSSKVAKRPTIVSARSL